MRKEDDVEDLENECASREDLGDDREDTARMETSMESRHLYPVWVRFNNLSTELLSII